jgi:hypothetical protein
MMDRSSRQRISRAEKLLSKAEELVSIELKKHAKRREQMYESLRPQARRHATAVAAIVISGEPKIDEPLFHAWVRALRHYRITDEYGREFEYENWLERGNGYLDIYHHLFFSAYQQWYAAILNGANETEKFTEIFSAAPVWLLEFTQMEVDAYLLQFNLSEMRDKLVWGQKGLEDSKRWPFLPLGMMSDGDPVAEVAPESGVSPEDEERSHRRTRIRLRP